MLYIRQYPVILWDSWVDQLGQQIPFEFLAYRICGEQDEVVCKSPNKKYQVVLSTHDFSISDLNIVITTNSGAFHIVAHKKLRQFEVTLMPYGLYRRWHFFNFFRYLREHHLLMLCLNRICCAGSDSSHDAESVASETENKKK